MEHSSAGEMKVNYQLSPEFVRAESKEGTEIKEKVITLAITRQPDEELFSIS